MKKMRVALIAAIALAIAMGFFGCGGISSNSAPAGPSQVRLGYFANLTHA